MNKRPTLVFILCTLLTCQCLLAGTSDIAVFTSLDDVCEWNPRLLVNRSSFSPASNPKAGENVRLSIEVINAGNSASPAIVAQFRLPSGVSTRNGLTAGIPALGAGQSHMVNFNFTYTPAFSGNTISIVFETPSLPGLAGLKKTLFLGVNGQKRSVVRNQGSEVYWVSPDPDENRGAVRTKEKQMDLKVMALSEGELSKKNFAIRVNGRRAQGQKADLSKLKSPDQKDTRLNHSYTSGLELEEGRNEVEVVFFEEDGETIAARTKTIIIYYDPPVKSNIYVLTIGDAQDKSIVGSAVGDMTKAFKRAFPAGHPGIDKAHFYQYTSKKDITRMALIKSLARLERLPIQEQDWVFVYWAAAGRTSSNNSLLVEPSDFDVDYPEITALDLNQDILHGLEKAGGQKILLLDTKLGSGAKSGGQSDLSSFIRNRAPSVEVFLVDGAVAKGDVDSNRAILSQVLQEAMQNQTVVVGEGIRKQVDGGDQKVSVEELSDFIRSRVSFLLQNQRGLLHHRGSDIARDRTLLHLGQ